MINKIEIYKSKKSDNYYLSFIGNQYPFNRIFSSSGKMISNSIGGRNFSKLYYEKIEMINAPKQILIVIIDTLKYFYQTVK